LRAIQNAMEQYYGVNTAYPTTCNSIVATYMQGAWPVDPINDATYFYRDETAGGGDRCTTSSYCICARLEAGSGGNAIHAGVACSWSNNGGYYCVKNLQ